MLNLESLSSDVLLAVFKYLDRPSLASVAQVCSRFRDIAYSDILWIEASRKALASNQLDLASLSRCQEILSARDKVKLGESWTKGDILESLVTVQNNRFMPRLQLEVKRLWIRGVPKSKIPDFNLLYF